MEKHKEEIDIFYLYNVLVNRLKKFTKFGFNVINFIKRTWIVLLVLVLAGVGYAYYFYSDTLVGKESKILVRINFDAVNYVYSKIDFLSMKIADKKDDMFTDESVPKELANLTGITIEPIISLYDVTENIRTTNTNFEGLLRYSVFEFDKDSEISNVAETFKSEYKYHYIEISTNGYAESGIIEKLIAYLNDNSQMQELKDLTIQSIKDAIQNNIKTIEQINEVITIYNQGGSLPSAHSEIFVVDKDFSIADILTKKVELERGIDISKIWLVNSKDLVMNINHPSLYIGERSFLDNKIIYYPLLFVFIFFLLAGIRGLYFSLKRFSEN